MKKRTSILCLILAILMLGSMVAGCSAETAAPKASTAAAATTAPAAATAKPAGTTAPVASAATTTTSGGKTIGLILGMPDLTFFKLVEEGANSRLRSGDKIISYYCNWNLETLLKQTEDLVSKKVDAIIFDPIQPDGVKPALQLAYDAGIPVITYDGTTDNPELIKARVVSDDYTAGYLCGKALCEGIGKKGVVQSYVATSTRQSQNRLAGFKAAVAEFPDVKHVYNCEEKFDAANALKVFENMLNAHPETNGFFCSNQNIATAAMTVLESNKLTGKILVTNVDATTVMKDNLAAGKVYACADQFAQIMGSTAMDITYMVLDGVKFDTSVPIMIPVKMRYKGDDYYNGKK